MSVLRNLESKIADLVEGAFSRAFRSEVRPLEIARRLAREMDLNATHSVSRTYAPNEYVVYLSPEDRERLAEYEDALVVELSGYLLEHARAERLELLTQPSVELETDDRLRLGEFGIQARLVQSHGTGARAANRGQTMIYTTADRLNESLEEAARPHRATAILRTADHRYVVAPEGARIGRGRDCDIVLADPNVSREHARLRPSGGAWVIEDLGSTNGVRVNGRRLAAPCALSPGDRLELGTSTMAFELE